MQLAEQMEALQREVFLRSQYWQQQGQKEEKILSDLDMALLHFLGEATQASSTQVSWGLAAWHCVLGHFLANTVLGKQRILPAASCAQTKISSFPSNWL